MAIAVPKGNYRRKTIIVDDGTTSYDIETIWCCTGCGYDTRTDPILEYFPSTGKQFHTWHRTCMCMTPEYWYDLVEQARLYGQILTKDGRLFSIDVKEVFCTDCKIHCPYADSNAENYTCWTCRNYKHYRSTYDDDY